MLDYFFPVSFLVFEFVVILGVRLSIAAVGIFYAAKLANSQEDYEEGDDSYAVPA